MVVCNSMCVADKELFEAHFGFSCERCNIDLEVDLSEAAGDSYRGK